MSNDKTDDKSLKNPKLDGMNIHMLKKSSAVRIVSRIPSVLILVFLDSFLQMKSYI